MEEQKVQDTNNDPPTKDEILNPNSSSSSNSTQQQQQKESVEEEELKRLLVPGVRDLPLTPTSAVESNFVPYFTPAMRKKISLKKLAQLWEKSKVATSSTKGVVIREKRPRVEVSDNLPSKKGKMDSEAKDKGPASPPKDKKKATSTRVAKKGETSAAAPREGTLVNLGIVFGPRASMLGSPFVAEKILGGVIPPLDKENVKKLTLDQVATKFFHTIGQAVVLGSSLVVRNKEARDEVNLQQGRVASLEGEMARAQKLANDLEGQLATTRVREQQAAEELRKVARDRDVMVVRLKKQMAHAKKLAIEEFKSSNDFQDAVELIAYKYFGEGFEFCKRQLARHHPDLGINLEDMGIDQDLLEEEEKEKEKGEQQEEKGGDKGDTSPSLLECF